MTAAINTQFINDIPAVLQRYKNLKVVERHGMSMPILKGVIDVPNDDGRIIGNYLIEIHSTPLYPFRFPKLFEVGGEIENIAARHKYADASCCITVLPDEIIKSANGLTIADFLDNYGLGYFANQVHFDLFGYYKNGEYPHGIEAFAEFYSSLIGGNYKRHWAYWALCAFRKIPTPEHNCNCQCGSGLYFKDCHLPKVQALQVIGESVYLNSIKGLL